MLLNVLFYSFLYPNHCFFAQANSCVFLFNQLNSLSFSISITWSIMLSFLLTYADLCLKISFCNSAKLLIWFSSFSVDFYIFHQFLLNHLLFGQYHFFRPDFVNFLGFLFRSLISCFEYLHFCSLFFKLLTFFFPWSFVSSLFNSFLNSSLFLLSPKYQYSPVPKNNCSLINFLDFLSDPCPPLSYLDQPPPAHSIPLPTPYPAY